MVQEKKVKTKLKGLQTITKFSKKTLPWFTNYHEVVMNSYSWQQKLNYYSIPIPNHGSYSINSIRKYAIPIPTYYFVFTKEF